MKKEDWEEKLQAIVCSSEDSSRSYELAIGELVDGVQINDSELEDILQSIIKDNIVNNKALSYASFYALCTFHRRYRNVKEYGDLLRQWYQQFREFASYDFLELMYEQNTHVALENLIVKAYKLCYHSKMKENIGVIHLFCELVADSCEWKIDSFGDIYEKWFGIAETKIEEAISVSALASKSGEAYPKFYCTKSRLLFLKALQCEKRSDAEKIAQEAIRYIEKATDLEKSNKKAMDYQIINAKRQAVFYQKMLEKTVALQTETINSRINKLNIHNLEFLGFFSAIITLISSDIMIINNNTFEDSINLMIIMTGCLLIAFGSFSLIIDNQFCIKNDWKRLGIILIGFFLILIYIGFC